MTRRNLYYNYIGYPNYYEDGGLVGRPNGVQLIPIETKGISPSDTVNPNAGNGGGDNKFLNAMNSSGGGWASAIAPAATNIANAFLDTEASTADRVAGAMGIPALANQWRADTSKGDAYIKDMQNSMDLNSKNYIQDASSSWGGANAVKQNLKTNITPISFNSAVPSLKDFKGNWWRNMGASVAQGAASGSVGGHWGALGGAVTGLFGSIGGLFGRKGRAERAYKDFLAKRNTLVSAQEAAYNRAVTDQTLSNMQALANGNTQQRINDMANIRAYGGNLFDDGGDLTDEQQMVLADIQADPRILFTPKYSQWRDYIRRTSPDYLDRLYTSLPYEQQQDIYQNDREAWGALSNKAKGDFGGTQVRKKTDEVSPYVAGALGLVGAAPAMEAVSMFPMLENGLNAYFGYEGAKNLPTAVTDAYDYAKKGDWSRAGLSAGEAALDGMFIGNGIKGAKNIANGIKYIPNDNILNMPSNGNYIPSRNYFYSQIDNPSMAKYIAEVEGNPEFQTRPFSKFYPEDETLSYLRHNSLGRTRKYGTDSFSSKQVDEFDKAFNNYMKDYDYQTFNSQKWKKAGKEDLAGFHDKENKYIAAVEDYEIPLKDIKRHEVRHAYDNYGDILSNKQHDILDNAYGSDFVDLPKNVTESDPLKGYSNMFLEKTTTNLDARKALLKGREETASIDVQNMIIDKMTDEKIIEAVRNSNGYGRRYIEYLEKNNLLTPQKVQAFRNAMKYVGTGIGIGLINNNTEYAMGGNLYTDLSPNMMSLWNNKQQIDQQKVNTQQMNFGLGNSFNQKINRFDDGGWFDLLFGNGAMQAPTPAQGVTESNYTPAAPYSTLSELRRRSYLSQQAVENARRNREADIEFWDRYRNDWGDRTPEYANMSEKEFLQESEGLHDNPNITGLPLSEYNRYKYRKYLNYPNNKTFGNAYLFRPSIDELRKKYPLEDLPVYKKGNSWYLKEGVPAINGYKNLESGGHKIHPEDFQDTIDELRRRAWDNEFYDYRQDTGEDLPNSIQFEGNPDTYYMQDNGKYMNDKGEYWDAGNYDDIRYLMSDGRAYDPNVGNTVKQQKREQYLKYKKEQEERAKKREEEGHVNDYWHKDIDDDFMSNPIVEHDEIVVKGDKPKKSDNVEYKPTQRQVGYKKLSEDLGGSEGVKHFQEQYNLYHPESRIKVDGKVGDETVRAFQSWNNEYGSDNVYGLNKLNVDGIYGEKSQEFMSSGIAKRNLEFAYGGKLFANGGQMDSSDLPDNAQYYANGGTHEENPYGGIQVGTDQQGNPNLVEEGEFRWGDYIFSDRINVDPTLLSRYNLAPATKHQGKKANKGKLSYADMAKKYAKKNNELANDPIGKNTLEAYMKRLQDAQEDQKFQDSMEQQKQDAINQYRSALSTPQQGNPMYSAMKYNGMGNAATQQGVNAGMSDLGQQGGGNEVLSNTNRSGNNMLHAFGGNLFWDGGTPQIKPKLLNVNPNLVLGDNYMDSWTANNAGTPRLFSSTTPMYTGENPEANFTAYQKRYPTLPSDAKGMQQLLVNEGYDIGNTGQNKDGVDGIWGNKSQAAWYDFLRAYNHRPNTMNQYDLISSNNQPSTSNSQISDNGGLNLGVRDGDATTDNNNLGNGQTSYNNVEGNINIGRSNLTDGIKRDTTTTFGTAAIKEDPKQVPHYSTAGEYAMFGKGFTPMLYDWMNKTNFKYDPNQRPAYELANMGNNSTFLRTADTIGGYRAPNLMDAERMNNAAQAQGIAALQAALNVGNGNRGFAAAQTAQNAYNTQMGIGNNYVTAQQANNEERYKTDAYNTAIDQFNANARNTSYQDNQKARQIGQQMAIDAKKAANDYILRNELYADATNRQAMDNRAANQATWTDNALNYFIAQAQKNDILNAKNNDITNPYWTDKNGVMHYIGDSGLNSAIYNAFTDGSKEWGDYAVNNGTFSGDRLKAWNALQEKYSAADLKAHPELWKSLVLQEKQARKEEAEKAELAKTDRLNNQRYAFDNNMAQLNNYRTLYGDKFTDGQWYDDLMKRYNDAANANEFNDVNNLEYWNRVIGDKLNYWQRYNTPVTANQSAYGGYINNNNKSNKREYYNYMRR